MTPRKERLLMDLDYVRASEKPGKWHPISLSAEERMRLLCDIIQEIIEDAEVQNDGE